MLFKCIRAELMKLRRSFVWFACVVIPLIPAGIGTANYLFYRDTLQGQWYALWTQHTLFYSCFFFSPLIAVYCAYLWRVENYGHNRNVLMTTPVPLSCIFFGKLAVAAAVTLLTQLWVFALFTVCGKYAGLPGLPPAEILFWCLRGGLGGIVIAAALLLLCQCIRSFALPIGLSLVLTMAGFLFSNKGWSLYFPFSLLTAGMNANHYDDQLSGEMLRFLGCCGVWFLLFCAAALWLLQARDVKA